jgi:Holliday junction DNA helicase RuvA
MFIHLLSVSGVGANTARVILSYLTVEEVRHAIIQENDAGLSKVKGIGPKTAKRIILDLKEKILKDSGEIHVNINTSHNTLKEEALIALISLGFTRNIIEKKIVEVLKKNPEIDKVEDLIKVMLKQMN